MAINPNIPISVHTRATWAGSWVAQPNLEPLRASDGVAPQIGDAVLQLRYGSVKQPTASVFATAAPLSLTNHYVRLQNTEYGVDWYGVIIQDARDLRGAAVTASPVGMQTLTAAGMEHLLDRIYVDKARAMTSDGVAPISRCPAFNLRNKRGGSLLGNRSAEKSMGSYYFDRAGEVWSAADVLEFLVARFAIVGPTWALGGLYADLANVWDVYELDGLTVWQAIQRVVDRRRGYGVRIQCTDTTATVYVFSVLDTDLTVGDATFHANAFPLELASDDDGTITQAPVVLDQSAAYDRIRVRGARVKSCFTVSPFDETLEKGWTDAQEDEYRNPTLSSPPSVAERMTAYDKARAQTKLSRVFRFFRIPPGWDWKVAGGNDIGATPMTANPIIGDDGSVTAAGAYAYDFDRALLARLPLFSGVKYDVGGWPAEADEPDDSEPEMLDPLVILKDAAGKFRRVDDIQDASYPNASVRMATREMGFDVKFNPAHILAMASWGLASPSWWTPGFAWTELLATVAVETDEHLQVVVEAESGVPDCPRELVIDVPEAELWYVAGNTVFGVTEAGELRRVVPEDAVAPYTPGGHAIIRNDADQLTVIAKLAARWYGRARAAITMTWRTLGAVAAPGTLIAGVRTGNTTLATNSVVTSRTWDFVAGTTTIKTGYWDLDARTAGLSPRVVDRRHLSRMVDRADSARREEDTWYA